MEQYLELLKDVLDNGTRVASRPILKSTGEHPDVFSVFGRQKRFDLSATFPIVTTKRISFKLIVGELLWFLKGSTNVQWLREHKNTIWDEWARADGSVGPVYGKQWRAWRDYEDGSIDQIAEVIRRIRSNDTAQRRRLIVSAWNVAELKDMALPPCHAFFQFYVANNRLSCQMYQRSCDLFLGVPFNISSYALLTCMIAHITGLKPGEFIHTYGDLHIYENHLKQCREQLTRTPFPLPTLWFNPEVKEIDDFGFDDIKLENYNSCAALAGEVAI